MCYQRIENTVKKYIGQWGASGLPIAKPSTCTNNSPLNVNVLSLRQNSRARFISKYFKLAYLYSFLDVSGGYNVFRTYSITSLTGTFVSKLSTSYETKYASCKLLCPRNLAKLKESLHIFLLSLSPENIFPR